MTHKEKILWLVFSLHLAVIVVTTLFFHSLRPDFNNINPVALLAFGVPILLLILHSLWTLNYPRGLLFILLAMILGLLAEIIGVNYGVIFGGKYVYTLLGPTIFGIPFVILVYWAAFAYTGYIFTTSLVYWKGKEKPNYKAKDWRRLPLLILYDGLLITTIDLVMDPLQVRLGSWVWTGKADFFGVPSGNFIGWLFISMVICGLYRVFEYFYPKKETITKIVYIMPVIGYGFTAVSLAYMAAINQLVSLSLIGLVLMLPPVVVNLYLFNRYQKRFST